MPRKSELRQKIVDILRDHPEGMKPMAITLTLFPNLRNKEKELEKAHSKVKTLLRRMAAEGLIISNFMNKAGHYGLIETWGQAWAHRVKPKVQNITLQYNVPEGVNYNLISNQLKIELDKEKKRYIYITLGEKRLLTVQVAANIAIPIDEITTYLNLVIALAEKAAGISIEKKKVWVETIELSYDWDKRFMAFRIDAKYSAITLTEVEENFTILYKIYDKGEYLREEMVFKLHKQVPLPRFADMLFYSATQASLMHRMALLEKAIYENVIPSQKTIMEMLQTLVEKSPEELAKALAKYRERLKAKNDGLFKD